MQRVKCGKTKPLEGKGARGGLRSCNHNLFLRKASKAATSWRRSGSGLRLISISSAVLLTQIARPSWNKPRMASIAPASLQTRDWLWSSVRRFKQHASR
jgi:hypothetical protein